VLSDASQLHEYTGNEHSDNKCKIQLIATECGTTKAEAAAAAGDCSDFTKKIIDLKQRTFGASLAPTATNLPTHSLRHCSTS